MGELTRLYERSIVRVPDPDLLVYVELPASRCAARIAARGRAAERGIGLDYLAALERAYERFSTSWARSPVVRLDALRHDPREPDAVRHLAARVRAALGAPAR